MRNQINNMLWLHSGENAVQKCELMSWCTSLAYNPGASAGSQAGWQHKNGPSCSSYTYMYPWTFGYMHTNINNLVTMTDLWCLNWYMVGKKTLSFSQRFSEISKDILLVVSLNCVSVFAYEHMHIYICAGPRRAAYKCYGQNKTTTCNPLCPANVEILIRLR